MRCAEWSRRASCPFQPVQGTSTASPGRLTNCPWCASKNWPDGATVEPGWSGLVVAGPLDFSLTGILSAIAEPLATAGVAIFAVSTYDTDYVFVKADRYDDAVSALESAGHTVHA